MQEADMWSFGCLLSELLTLHVPYAGLSESEVHSRIQVLTPLKTYVIVGLPIVMPKFRYALRLFMAIATTLRGKYSSKGYNRPVVSMPGEKGF
jgi:serine/threonine protein kinase